MLVDFNYVPSINPSGVPVGLLDEQVSLLLLVNSQQFTKEKLAGALGIETRLRPQVEEIGGYIGESHIGIVSCRYAKFN